MTFLPIVDRELREGARRKSTRYIRLIVAAVALVMSLFQIVFMPLFTRSASSVGSTGFAIMTGYAFVLCLLSGIFNTADCLSEEKREGTLGLLFLTDLRGYDVVLGKLASQMIHLGYALLAIIPAAALPMLLGGVTGGELWRISLALLNLLFFSMAAGMFSSALCKKAGRAVILAAVIVTVACILSPLIQFIANQVSNYTSTARLPWFNGFSPAEAYGRAMESSFAREPGRFWTSLGVLHLFAWLLIIIASWWLPRSWQDKPRGPSLFASALPVSSGVEAAASQSRTERRRVLLDTDPLQWLVGGRRGLRGTLWVIAVVWGGISIVSTALMSDDGIPVVLVSGWIALFVTKLLFAFEACRFFADTRRAGAFELLLGTPINANKFVNAQWKSLWGSFGPPLLTALGVGFLCVLYGVIISMTKSEEMGVIGTIGIVATLGVALIEVMDFVAMGWLGMWLALTMRKPHLAAGATILYVIILPSVTVCYAWMFGFVVDVILIAVFATKMRMDLRHLVLERPALQAERQAGG